MTDVNLEAEASAEAPKRTRGEALAVTRKAKFDEYFLDKKYSIIGEVHLDKDPETGKQQVFQTPFGNKGRHGFVLQEEGTDNKVVVGATVLRKAAKEYGAVELPEKRTRRAKAESEPGVDGAAG